MLKFGQRKLKKEEYRVVLKISEKFFLFLRKISRICFGVLLAFVFLASSEKSLNVSAVNPGHWLTNVVVICDNDRKADTETVIRLMCEKEALTEVILPDLLARNAPPQTVN
ncbi:MAG: hypothetical protein LBF33_01200 [Oscillospiraceae bacterium]|nr:hypothetical protein [Oscillospiraceae bacterium]